MSSTQAMKHPGLNLGASHGKDDDKAEEMAFGFWVFMMSDAILFGVLFVTYVTMMGSTAGGPGAHELFELKSAFIETLLLLASSFTYGMASLAMKYRHSQTRMLGWLAATALLGLVFLGMELHDFMKMANEGGVPGRSGFISAFFALVPLHGIHVTAGLIWLFAIVGQVLRYGVDGEVKIGILRLGLFWHFLDIVWVAIFSVVYLGGLA